jgi:DNA-binding MurR/RpiR family transcriptional regulator
LADAKRQIFIMGQRTSFGLAHQTWILLKYLRGGVNLIGGSAATIAEEIADATQKDALILISHRRYSDQTVTAAKIFSKMGASIIALVDADNNPYAKLAKIQMVIPTFGLSMFDSGCATLAFIESLILAVAQYREKKMYKRFESTEKLFKQFETFYGE